MTPRRTALTMSSRPDTSPIEWITDNRRGGPNQQHAKKTIRPQSKNRAKMTPREIIDRTYLGDRGCVAFDVSADSNTIKIVMDSLCVLDEGATRWIYGEGREIEGGELVFSNVRCWNASPFGLTLCDWVEFIDVSKSGDGFLFTLSVGASGTAADTCLECILRIESATLSVVDPLNRSVPILISD